MRFRAKVNPSGNATAVEVPPAIRTQLGGSRPPITVTINGHSWRSRLALMRGQCLIGISAANRTASGVEEGDVIEVEVEVDEEPRVVSEPADLASALDRNPGVRTRFDQLPFGLRRKHVASIDDAKTPGVRARRIAKLIETLDDTSTPLRGRQ